MFNIRSFHKNWIDAGNPLWRWWKYLSPKHKYFAVTNISGKKVHKDVTTLAEVLRSLIVNFSSSTRQSKKVARRLGESESPESE